MASASSHFPKIFLVNNTEGTLVANSISWTVSIGCDQRVHLWQLNKEYTNQTILFTHKFQTAVYHSDSYFLTITIKSFRASCLGMLFYANDCLRHISTISVNYIQAKPYYAYLSG